MEGKGFVRVAVAILGLVLVAGACTPPPGGPTVPPGAITDLECEQLITTDVFLMQDVVCTDPIWEVGAPNLVIDLNGHTIRRTNTTFPPCGIDQCGSFSRGGYFFGAPTYTDFTIKNGTLDRIWVAAGELLAGLRFVNGAAAQIANGRITNNTFDGGAIVLDGPARADDNTLTGGGIYVDNLEAGFNDYVIADNTITGGGIKIGVGQNFGGPLTELGGDILRNNVTSSPSHGIWIGGTGSTTGAIRIAGNVVTDSANSGIAVVDAESYVPLGGPITLSLNQSNDNGGHGIELVDPNIQYVDGGGNAASGNALDPQCIGVACS